jgi:hypothetical protein
MKRNTSVRNKVFTQKGARNRIGRRIMFALHLTKEVYETGMTMTMRQLTTGRADFWCNSSLVPLFTISF